MIERIKLTQKSQNSLDDDLAGIAAKIRDEYRKAEFHLKHGIDHALVIGLLLIEAKGKLKHGQWLPWLQKHCKMPERTAQLYMQLVKYSKNIKSADLADLTIEGVLKQLSKPKLQITHQPSRPEPEPVRLAVEHSNVPPVSYPLQLHHEPHVSAYKSADLVRAGAELTLQVFENFEHLIEGDVATWITAVMASEQAAIERIERIIARLKEIQEEIRSRTNNVVKPH